MKQEGRRKGASEVGPKERNGCDKVHWRMGLKPQVGSFSMCELHVKLDQERWQLSYPEAPESLQEGKQTLNLTKMQTEIRAMKGLPTIGCGKTLRCPETTCPVSSWHAGLLRWTVGMCATRGREVGGVVVCSRTVSSRHLQILLSSHTQETQRRLGGCSLLIM